MKNSEIEWINARDHIVRNYDRETITDGFENYIIDCPPRMHFILFLPVNLKSYFLTDCILRICNKWEVVT